MEVLVLWENIKWIISTAISLPKSRILRFLKKNPDERIEIIQAKVATSDCDWYQDQGNPQAFFIQENAEKTSPVLDFSFFNHFSKPVVLKSIEVNIKHFPLGLRGLDEEPVKKVQPSVRYYFNINHEQNQYAFPLDEPLEIAHQRAYRFQMELLFPDNTPLIQRHGIWVTFHFNSKISVKAEPILLNATNEEGTLLIQVLN